MSARAPAPPTQQGPPRRRPSVLASLLAVLGLCATAGWAGGPVRAHAEDPSAPVVVYGRPVEGHPLRGFEAPAQRWSAGHRGVDLVAEVDETVRAPAEGLVTFAGPVAGRSLVVVQHPDGRRSTLEPVDVDVARGQTVLAGERLGTLAATSGHCAPRACLHWGVREPDDTYLDPLSLLPGGGPVVLLPRG